MGPLVYVAYNVCKYLFPTTLYGKNALVYHVSHRDTFFCHLRRFRQIRRLTGNYVMIQLVVAFDYCNAVLGGLPCQP